MRGGGERAGSYSNTDYRQRFLNKAVGAIKTVECCCLIIIIIIILCLTLIPALPNDVFTIVQIISRRIVVLPF